VQAEWILSFSCASTTPRAVVVNASLHLLSAVLHPAWRGAGLLSFQRRARALRQRGLHRRYAVV